MPYVDRTAGVVSGLYNRAQSVGQEFLPDNNAEVLAFLNPVLQPDDKTVSIAIPKIVDAAAIVALGALVNGVAVPAWAKTILTQAALAITTARNS